MVSDNLIPPVGSGLAFVRRWLVLRAWPRDSSDCAQNGDDKTLSEGCPMANGALRIEYCVQ